MRYGYVKLCPGQGARESRVRVAVHEQAVRPLLDRYRLDAGQHRACLRPVRAGADLEIDVRGRDPELPEEKIRHRVVVVLAGVDEKLLVRAAQGTRDRSRLDELGTGAEHGEDFHR